MKAIKQVAIKCTFHWLRVKREAALRISDQTEFQHRLAYFVKHFDIRVWGKYFDSRIWGNSYNAGWGNCFGSLASLGEGIAGWLHGKCLVLGKYLQATDESDKSSGHFSAAKLERLQTLSKMAEHRWACRRWWDKNPVWGSLGESWCFRMEASCSEPCCVPPRPPFRKEGLAPQLLGSPLSLLLESTP